MAAPNLRTVWLRPFHVLTALTLPGLESMEVDRSRVTFTSHVEAICTAVKTAERPVVLAVHSARGAPGYAVTDVMPERIAVIVYVDSAPARGAINPNFKGVEWPLPAPEQLAADENLDGLGDEQLATFRTRAIPEPASTLREAWTFSNNARTDVRSILICTGASSEQVKASANEGHAWLAGLAELRNVVFLDLPTSHWPMWSRPRELTEILARVAAGDAS